MQHAPLKLTILTTAILIFSNVSYAQSPHEIQNIKSINDARLSPDERNAMAEALSICNDVLSQDWKTPIPTFTRLAKKYLQYDDSKPNFFWLEETEVTSTDTEFIAEQTSSVDIADQCLPRAIHSATRNSVGVAVCLSGTRGSYNYATGKTMPPTGPDWQQCTPREYSMIRGGAGPWRLQFADNALKPASRKIPQ
jgi:hypothetical protein